MSEDIKELVALNKQLLKEVNELKVVCGRMDNHITFVESTYSILRTPLNWFLSKWYNVCGYLKPHNKELPLLDNSDDLKRVKE